MEKKEIWKLLELLNEYRTEKGERSLNEFEVSQTLDSLNYLRLFIKWLVENDKIDFSKDAFVSLASELWCTAYDEKIVLMVLSISDTPIDLLCSLLK